MDLGLYGRVLWRFRSLVVTGLILAVSLAFLSLVRVTSHGFYYRKPAVWQSQAVLLLNAPGFPYGRTLLPSTGSSTPPQYVNLAGLTDLYSQFANSDDVKRLMRAEGAPKTWSIIAAPAVPTITGADLPVIQLSGRANSAGEAVSAVRYGTRALVEYVSRQQQVGKIPTHQRVGLQSVQRASRPVVVEPRKKTLAIVVFLAVLVATVGLAFILENLRPRVRTVGPATPAVRAVTEAPAEQPAVEAEPEADTKHTA